METIFSEFFFKNTMIPVKKNKIKPSILLIVFYCRVFLVFWNTNTCHPTFTPFVLVFYTINVYGVRCLLVEVPWQINKYLNPRCRRPCLQPHRRRRRWGHYPSTWNIFGKPEIMRALNPLLSLLSN